MEDESPTIYARISTDKQKVDMQLAGLREFISGVEKVLWGAMRTIEMRRVLDCWRHRRLARTTHRLKACATIANHHLRVHLTHLLTKKNLNIRNPILEA